MLTLLDISTIWSLFHVMVLNAILYEPRVPKKKAILLTILFMGPLVIYNSWFFIRFGPELAGQAVIFNCTLPSLLFFWLMAKHRNGRILFTFCLSDTISLELVYITRFLDDLIGIPNYWVLFILRLIIWPVLEWVIFKWLRKPYLQIQKVVRKGWGGFAAITALFYIVIVVMGTYPTVITERWEYLPAFLLVMVLMPLIYWCILTMLFHQQKLFQMQEQTQLLRLQSSMMQQRVEETARTEELLAIQRHDLRHRFQTLGAMLENGNLQAAKDYISSSEIALSDTKVRRWCLNPVLDAVFAAYFRQAEAEGIRIEADLDIPKDLHVDAAELSIVFANALDNAISAAKQLPLSERVIICKCIRYPQLMFRVSNPFIGTVHFDSNGRPVAKTKNHGIGTRSITAYCEKYGAFCEYKAENGWFTVQIVQP